MRLAWSIWALEDRRAIYSHIEADSPRAAVEMDERFEAAVQGLRDFPDSGRLDRVEGTRELVVAGTAYIVPYRVLEDRVSLLRILHGAQLWPEQFDG